MISQGIKNRAPGGGKRLKVAIDARLELVAIGDEDVWDVGVAQAVHDS
jgi:hypothetical protein